MLYEPNRDCFAYRNDSGRGGECTALDALYCAIEKKDCPFYKKKGQKHDNKQKNYT